MLHYCCQATVSSAPLHSPEPFVLPPVGSYGYPPAMFPGVMDPRQLHSPSSQQPATAAAPLRSSGDDDDVGDDTRVRCTSLQCQCSSTAIGTVFHFYSKHAAVCSGCRSTADGMDCVGGCAPATYHLCIPNGMLALPTCRLVL